MAVSEHRERFGDAHIAVVTFAERERLAAHRQWLLDRRDATAGASSLDVAWLADPERTLYRALELSRASLWRLYNPGTIRLYARLLRSGRRMRKPVDDTRQLGGDAVFGPDGRLHRVFRPPSPDARPSVDELVGAVGAARQSDAG